LFTCGVTSRSSSNIINNLLLIKKVSGSAESWVLVPSVTPEEVKTSTQVSVDTTLESKVITTTLGTKVVTLTPPVVHSTLSENLTIEVTSSEEDLSTEKIEETTLNQNSVEEQSEEQIKVGEDPETEIPENSSEEIEESEEEATERMTTEYPETTETLNVNLTSPQMGNDSINSINNFHFY
jgi:hypothetical protein